MHDDRSRTPEHAVGPPGAPGAPGSAIAPAPLPAGNLSPGHLSPGQPSAGQPSAGQPSAGHFSVGHLDRIVHSADGTPLAVSEAGSGPTLLVVGGAFDHHGTPTVDRLVRALRDRYRVVTYDRRGRGASGDTAPWSIEREIEDMAAVVTSVPGPVDALGTCVGAGLVLRGLAAGVPLRRAVLWEPPYRATVDPHADDVLLADVLDEHVAAGHRGQAVRAFLAQVLGLPMGQVTAARLRPRLWRALLADAHVLSRDVRVLGGLAVPQRVAEAVGVPVLVAAGDAGVEWMRAAAAALAEAVPGSRSLVVPGQGHVPDPVVLGHLVDRFTGVDAPSVDPGDTDAH
ncbi:alpha/beta fold hydrolase [Curtobacterium flaccumfaciens pv. beticola]|uniref:alpha/beta fold hydrolase n=1 Tax=Curtobacterium flaccumfaciens TaxID=2035 RepID=UPI00349F27EE|nr:alpha/beta fold hydrolase [Curtobacterium flaccumfaciens pv. basellae]